MKLFDIKFMINQSWRNNFFKSRGKGGYKKGVHGDMTN